VRRRGGQPRQPVRVQELCGKRRELLPPGLRSDPGSDRRQQPRAQLGDGAIRPGFDTGRGGGPRFLPRRSAHRGCGLRNVQQGQRSGLANSQPAGGSWRPAAFPARGADGSGLDSRAGPGKPPPVLRAMPPPWPAADRRILTDGLANVFMTGCPMRKRKGVPSSLARRRRRKLRTKRRADADSPPGAACGRPLARERSRTRETASCFASDAPALAGGGSKNPDRRAGQRIYDRMSHAKAEGGAQPFGSAPET
jgi:hypothetical protein